MSSGQTGLYTKMHQSRDDRQPSVMLFADKAPIVLFRHEMALTFTAWRGWGGQHMLVSTFRLVGWARAKNSNLKMGATKFRAFPRCNRKQKGLATASENFLEMYIIETKIDSHFKGSGRQETRGEKMKVSSTMLLKTNGEKMSVFRLSTMLMKTQELNPSFHDIDERKGVY